MGLLKSLNLRGLAISLGLTAPFNETINVDTLPDALITAANNWATEQELPLPFPDCADGDNVVADAFEIQAGPSLVYRGGDGGESD